MTGPIDGSGPGASDPAQLSALLAELQATAEQLGAQLGDLGRAGAGAAAQGAEHLPALRRILEIAPPELRARLHLAATNGLSATRDLADWLLAQMNPQPEVPEPVEVPIGRATPPRITPVPTTWILTASVDNHLATVGLGFSVIGIKERNRKRAMEMEPGDLVIFYLTKVMAFAGAVRITGELYEDRTRIWPGQPGKPDAYPWRFATEKVIGLTRDAWVPAGSLQAELEHVQKWPADHWKLAFQGQLRTISAHDSGLLLDRLTAAAGVAA